MCSPFKKELHNTDQQQEISPQTLPLIVELQDSQAACTRNFTWKKKKKEKKKGKNKKEKLRTSGTVMSGSP